MARSVSSSIECKFASVLSLVVYAENTFVHSFVCLMFHVPSCFDGGLGILLTFCHNFCSIGSAAFSACLFLLCPCKCRRNLLLSDHFVFCVFCLQAGQMALHVCCMQLILANTPKAKGKAKQKSGTHFVALVVCLFVCCVVCSVIWFFCIHSLSVICVLTSVGMRRRVCFEEKKMQIFGRCSVTQFSSVCSPSCYSCPFWVEVQF